MADRDLEGIPSRRGRRARAALGADAARAAMRAMARSLTVPTMDRSGPDSSGEGGLSQRPLGEFPKGPSDEIGSQSYLMIHSTAGLEA